METKITEIADGIYRLSTFVPDIAPPAGFTFNQFLVLGDEPLMFHTGLRKMFPLNRDAVGRIIPPERLRWIAFGHFEADECGAMNEWLAVAPQAQAAHGQTGCMVSLNDIADRAPRVLEDGEVIDLGGGKRVRYIDTPHTPHGWDAGVLYEESTGTLLCGDLFTQLGDGPALTDGDIVGPAIAAEDMFQLFRLNPGMGATIRALATALAAHAGADARAVFRGRRRGRAARAGRRLRPAYPTRNVPQLNTARMEFAMSDVVLHLSGAALRYSQLAQGTRYTLDGLPNAVLKDIGFARSDIPFIAGKLVYKCNDPARDAIDRFDWNAVWRNATILRLPGTVLRLTLVAAATVSAVLVLSSAVLA